MRAIATAAFLGSSTVTGGALIALWGLALQQAVVLVIAGPPLMLLSGGIMLGTRGEDLDERMAENRAYLHHSRPQPRRRPLRPLTPGLMTPRRNGHRRRDILVGMPRSMAWPGGVERQ